MTKKRAKFIQRFQAIAEIEYEGDQPQVFAEKNSQLLEPGTDPEEAMIANLSSEMGTFIDAISEEMEVYGVKATLYIDALEPTEILASSLEIEKVEEEDDDRSQR